jgi:hypothetical protein
MLSIRGGSGGYGEVGCSLSQSGSISHSGGGS